MTSIRELLNKHRSESESSADFIRAIQNRCNVSQSTVYRWLDGVMPDGKNTMTLIEYFNAKKTQP